MSMISLWPGCVASTIVCCRHNVPKTWHALKPKVQNTYDVSEAVVHGRHDAFEGYGAQMVLEKLGIRARYDFSGNCVQCRHEVQLPTNLRSRSRFQM